MSDYPLSASRAGLPSIVLTESGSGGTFNIVSVGTVWYVSSVLPVSFVFVIKPFV